MKSAADVNPEPQRVSAGSVCDPIESTSLPDPAHLTDRVSIDVRGLALAIVTTVVVIFALQWAEKFFIPLLLGIIIATPSILSWCGWSGLGSLGWWVPAW